MNEKVELVLSSLIETYLKYNRPISSTTLKNEANLPYSASTIRYYLQSLEKNGLVRKEHFSSGSKPSETAMYEYWRSVLPKRLESIDIDILKDKCKELEIFAYVKMFDNQVLVNVYNFKDRFLILEFEKEEIVLKYDENLYNFLLYLIGLPLGEIQKIFRKYKIKNLKKFDNFYEYHAFNKKILYNILNDVEFHEIKELKYDNGVFKRGGVLLYKLSSAFEDKIVEALFVADIYSNFLELISSIKGGDNGKKA